MSNQLSAVLIAGHARFLKTPPYRLEFGGGSVLERTLQAFANFDEVVVVAVGETGAVEDAVSGRAKVITLEGENVPVGLQLKAGAEAISPKKGFAVAICDQAILTPELVDSFAEKFHNHPDKVLVPVCQRQIGMPSIFPADLKKEFETLGEDGSAWPIVQKHGDNLQEVEVYETSVIRHIEDMDDYHQMLRIAGIPLPETENEETPVG